MEEEEEVAAPQQYDISRYWCHACSQIVNPIIDIDSLKCPNCLGGFVEEMPPPTPPPSTIPTDFSDRALSLWAPILLGMMTNPHAHPPRTRFRRLDFDDYDDQDDEDDDDDEVENTDLLHRGLDSIIPRRRRRRSSAAILQLLQGIRAGMLSESEDDVLRARENNRDGGEGLILINPFNQTILVQGSSSSGNNNPNNHNRNQTSSFGSSLGDYFVGAGLDLLLQHLAENDPNRYGTPPAQKEVVEAMPTVQVDKASQCCVCLEDFEIGSEAKEMPCKHKFHGGCIIPWLQLHSSCPVCRYQLPSDESKLQHPNSSNSRSTINVMNRGGGGGATTTQSGGEGGGISENATRFSLPLPWPLSSLFGSQSTGNGANSSSATAATTSSSSSSSSAESSSNSPAAAAPP